MKNIHKQTHQHRFDHRTTNKMGQDYLSAIDGIFLKNIAKECENKDCVMDSANQVVIEYSVNIFDETLTWDTDESYSLAISTLGQLLSYFLNLICIGRVKGTLTWSKNSRYVTKK